MAERTRDRERDICEAWNKQIIQCQAAKQSYVDAALKAAMYYEGKNHNFLYAGKNSPDFEVTINKVYELVSVFGPLLYAQNPTRLASQRAGGNPLLTECYNRYLNYTPGEFGLKSSSKAGIDEGLINGRGIMFTGRDARTGLIVSKVEQSKNILIDPSEPLWYNGYYIMRLRRNVPLWEVAKRFGEKVARRFLGSNGEEAGGIAGEGLSTWKGESKDYDNPPTSAEDKSDLTAYETPRITYIEVYSKMGVGLRARKSDVETYGLGTAPDDQENNVAFAYEPSRKIIMSEPGRWPILYWADHGKHSWPMSCLDPAENRDHTWPISPITPALGEQKFLDWGWSFALAGIRRSVRNIGLLPTDICAKVASALKGNKSDILIEVDLPASERKDLLHQMQMMQLNPALLDILREVELLFEKRTGLYEILYGQSSKQVRSATEANIKAEFSRLRIDDVIDRVEDWQGEIARKEAIGARFLLDSPQMAPILGPELAQVWDYYKPGDIRSAIAEYDYTIQTGSMRKRTPQYRAEVAEKALALVGDKALLVGDLETYNKLQAEWFAANGVPNPEQYALSAPPPPEALGGSAPPPPEAPGPPVAPEVMAVENGQPVIGSPEGAV